MTHWIEIPIVKSGAILLAAVAAVGTVGDGLNGWQVIRQVWPFVTHGEMSAELDARKAARDQQWTMAQADTNKQLRDLNGKVDDLDTRGLRWRVEDYPTKILNAQTNLITLQTALTPTVTGQLRINLLAQIEETKDQIDALKSAQRADTCLLYHTC